MNKKTGGSILAIDIGIKRTGLAICDETRTAVRLLDNLVANSRKQAIEKIYKIINDENVSVIVIGIPEERSSHRKAVATRARGLRLALEEYLLDKKLSATVNLFDEAYTSRRASLLLAESGVKKKHRKNKLDSASAAVLLEDFIQFLNSELRKPDD